MNNRHSQNATDIKFTRHAAFWIKGVVPFNQLSEVSGDIQDFVYPYFKNYIHTDPASRTSLRDPIEKYLYELDPMGLADSASKNPNEYRPEADLIAWLLLVESLTPKTLWALWALQFHEDISPFKSETDPALISMVESIKKLTA